MKPAISFCLLSRNIPECNPGPVRYSHEIQATISSDRFGDRPKGDSFGRKITLKRCIWWCIMIHRYMFSQDEMNIAQMRLKWIPCCSGGLWSWLLRTLDQLKGSFPCAKSTGLERTGQRCTLDCNGSKDVWCTKQFDENWWYWCNLMIWTLYFEWFGEMLFFDVFVHVFQYLPYYLSLGAMCHGFPALSTSVWEWSSAQGPQILHLTSSKAGSSYLHGLCVGSPGRSRRRVSRSSPLVSLSFRAKGHKKVSSPSRGRASFRDWRGRRDLQHGW